ncbi:probable cytochrome P450 6a13 [Condylostylus longicornis]|uniref:probable cytochrome P450 6a13 n=1 Tax=Condylostylus longicornis TaxID=2530218 RepID=UPI00244DC314|nr:probable cytochrome P450 6a13 [Condylostylus longicornis]
MVFDIIIIVVLSFLFLIYLWFKYRFTYWKRKRIPYIKPIVPIGNLKDAGRTKTIGIRLYELYKEGKEINYPYVGIFAFFTPSLLAIDIDFIKTILIKDFQYFTDRNVYYNENDDPLSAHLFSIEGVKWKKLRTKMTPTFTSGKMKFMFPTIATIGERFGDTLESMLWNESIPSKKTLLEMKQLSARYTTDVIGTCAFGIDCNSLKDPKAKFRMIGKKSLEKPRMTVPLRLLSSQFPNFARKLHIKTEHDDVSEFFMGALKETIGFRERNDVRRNDFLDIMISLKNSDNEDERITFEEIAAQAYIFFLAGYETSSITLSFCLYELALNEDIQCKARSEITRVLEKYHNILTYDAVTEMIYVQQIIDETLRKYPPATTLQRKVAEDYKVNDTNDVIEKGRNIIISIYGIHHDPQYYPDPEKFDPDRFSIENNQKRIPLTYIPFGDGPRNCIGKRFGKLQTSIGLISLLSRFKFTKSEKTIEPLKFSPKSFILSPVGGVWLYVEKIYQSTEL